MSQCKYIFLILLTLLPDLLLAQSTFENVITDPSVGLRCKELLSERESKLRLKQKTRALIKRNQDLRRSADPKRKTSLSKLRHNFNKLKQEEHLLLLRIQTLEEKIIRTGCPGIVI